MGMTIELLLKLVFCHLIGDYVLQSDFIARTKGENWYHLFVHCVLYCLPFYLMFGFTWQLMFIFLNHIFIDALKARYKVINYTTDQVLHYIITLIYLVRWKVETTEFKAVIGIWLIAQTFIVPLIAINDRDKQIGLVVDYGALVLLIIMYFGLKLIGV